MKSDTRINDQERWNKTLSKITHSIKNKRGIYRKPIDYDMELVLKYILHIGLGYCDNFIIDKINKPIIQQMIKYFYADPTFEGDLKKGILIHGPKGTGKTLLFIIFKDLISIFNLNKKSSKNINFQISRTSNVVEKFERNGHEAIIQYRSKPYLFDDLGEENKNSMFYKNESNVMADIILDRSLKFIQHGLLTHATSNYLIKDTIKNKEWFKDFYGARVSDRMIEMFNMIKLEGESRRK